MSKFPKQYVLPEGSIFSVTLENVRADYAHTVNQFEDLSDEQKASQIGAFDEDQAEEWMGSQWFGSEIVTWGTPTGQVCETTRADWLARGIHSAQPNWASDYEVQAK